ncbi:MAG: hypothetical protein CMI17_06260 [Opitutaceae bacterium]|nr:hypothetical protein [Opitutaceae bacterium]
MKRGLFLHLPLIKELVSFVSGLSLRSKPTFTDSSQESGSNYCIPVSKWYGNRPSEGRLPLFYVAISLRSVKNKKAKT